MNHLLRSLSDKLPVLLISFLLVSISLHALASQPSQSPIKPLAKPAKTQTMFELSTSPTPAESRTSVTVNDSTAKANTSPLEATQTAPIQTPEPASNPESNKVDTSNGYPPTEPVSCSRCSISIHCPTLCRTNTIETLHDCSSCSAGSYSYTENSFSPHMECPEVCVQ